LILSSILLCEDVRREIRGTNTIVGQFTSLSGELGGSISFYVFLGVKDYYGVAKLTVTILNPDKTELGRFDTGDIVCTDKDETFSAYFKISQLKFYQYGKYNIVVTTQDKVELTNIIMKYNISESSGNKIYVDDKSIEVPRMNYNDASELATISKLFVRKTSKLDKPYSKVRFISQFNPSEGIGSVSCLLTNSMLNHGIRVNPIPIHEGPADTKFISGIEKTNIPSSEADITILNAFPPQLKTCANEKRILLFTYWEADKVKESWANISNTADSLFVPSNYVKEVYERSGVIKPVHVYAQPISKIFEYKEKEYSPYFTITFIGTCIPRKGIDIFCKAIDEVFGNDDSVRIRIHVKPIPKQLGDKREWLLDKYKDNIKYLITDNVLGTKDIKDMLQQSNLVVTPSRSEGLGLVPIQALICGTPVIIPRHSGFLEYCATPGVITIDNYSMVKSTEIYDGCMWYEPEFEELCNKLAYAKANISEITKSAVEGSRLLRDKYDPDNAYLALENIINNEVMT